MPPCRPLALVLGWLVLVTSGASVAVVGCLPSYAFDSAGPADASDATPGPDSNPNAADASADTLGDADATLDARVDGAVDAAPLTPALVGVGLSASCALMADGTVTCWGSNALASLGANEAPDATAPVPQPVPGLAHVTSLAVGSAHTCVVLEGGLVECWGPGGEGELGGGNGLTQDTPALIQSLQYEDGGAIGIVAAGENHTCAVGVDGVTLWCWGYYAGVGASNSSDAPVYLATLDAGVVEMSAGDDMTCERDVNGAVWCWGENAQGALGQGDALAPSAYVVVPVRVPLEAPAAQLSVGRLQACVVTTAHDLVCWGDDSLAQFGPITIPDGGTYVASPTSIPIGPGHITKVGCGDNHTCALFDDGGVECWGYNGDGELGIAMPPNGELYPTPVPGLGTVTDLFVHYQSACAKLAGGGVACWGNDTNGQLGAGTLPATPVGAYPVTFP